MQLISLVESSCFYLFSVIKLLNNSKIYRFSFACHNITQTSVPFSINSFTPFTKNAQLLRKTRSNNKLNFRFCVASHLKFPLLYFASSKDNLLSQLADISSLVVGSGGSWVCELRDNIKLDWIIHHVYLSNCSLIRISFCFHWGFSHLKVFCRVALDSFSSTMTQTYIVSNWAEAKRLLLKKLFICWIEALPTFSFLFNSIPNQRAIHIFCVV